MHDRLFDVMDEVIERKSPPQKHAVHAASASRNSHLPDEEARGQELQFMQKIVQEFSPSSSHLHDMPHSAESRRNPSATNTIQTVQGNSSITDQSMSLAAESTAALMDQCSNRVRALPDIRSALVALDEMDAGVEWSSAFSLPKADLEPWTSFFRGYKKSSLFTMPGTRDDAGQGGQTVSMELQCEVRAILELKRMDAKFILEPPVQIDQPAEYLDLFMELKACRDPLHAQGLAKIANEVHDNLLAQAVEKGRAMGDRLYHALLGPEFTNLSKEWEKVYQRKPSVDELCYMLTTGRIKIIPAKRQSTDRAQLQQDRPAPRAPQYHLAKPDPVSPTPVVNKAPPGSTDRRQPAPDPAANAMPTSIAAAAPAHHSLDSATRKATSVERKIVEETHKRNRFRKVLRHICQATVCCAALVAHALAS